MKNFDWTQVKRAALAVLLALVSASAFGQGYKGSVTVDVTTPDGGPLPGAVVTISASTFNRSFVTNPDGEVRFVGLTPDSYELKVVMAGFNTIIRPGVTVETGQNVKLSIGMQPSTTQEEMVVTAETPLMDVTKVGTSTVLTTEEMTALPQARDPWAVLDTVPGIQSDRINVGGNESGQQSTWVGKGDDGDNAAWVIDGVEFTDPSAEGASQSYLDFGMFGQIGFQTGGGDVSSGSSGTVLNFVTKQGSNEHTGSMRLLFADRKFSSSSDSPTFYTEAFANGVANNPAAAASNKVIETFEKGFELGGPIIKDRVWYWASFAQNDIDNRVRSGQRDKTILENISVKLHGDITPTTRATFFWTEGDKQKDGRGAGPSRQPETTWDQNGPTPIYKYEISQLVGQTTELQFIYGRVDGKFNLIPKTDPETVQAVYDEAVGTWRNTYYTFGTNRPTRQYIVKGNTFLNFGNTDHEFTYGFEYKEAEAVTKGGWGKENQNIWLDDYSGLGSQSYFFAYRDADLGREFETTNIYIQDTVTVGNLTLKGGLRFVDGEGNNLAADVPANPFFPEALPALAYNGDESQFSWETVSPSLGATYTFGDDNQYLVRGSFRRYFDNISLNEIDFNNPVDSSWILGYWDDLNGNGQFEAGEGSFPGGDPYGLGTNDVNLDDPSAAIPVNSVDPNLDPPQVDELIIGAEWSITPEFTVAATYTHRERSEELWSPIIGVSRADYEVVGTVEGINPVTGQSYSQDVYGINAGVAATVPARAELLTNRPGYEEVFDGFEFTATKRLSNRWMLRGFLSLNDWTRSISANGVQDPTLDSARSVEDGTDMVVQSTGSGSKGDVWMGSATWTANVNGLYQLPYDINISGNILLREGFAAPLFVDHGFRDGDGQRTEVTNVSIAPIDTLRMDDIFNVNAKISKIFTIGRTKVDVAAEFFNLTNDDAALQIRRQVNRDNFGEIRETLSPRLMRFSATINF